MSTLQFAMKRILLVDSDEDTCEMLNFYLSEYEITPASTAVDGLRLARRDRFDLVLLAYRLSDGCGTDLCRDIHEMRPRTPIIFFSAVAIPNQRQLGHAAGAQDWLVKPNDLDVLKATIARLICNAEVHPNLSPVNAEWRY